MPNYNWSQRLAAATSVLGIRVDRATDTLPQTAAEAIFNIVGGRVCMTGILGEVTVVLGTVGNLNLEANPSGAGTTSVLDAVVAGGAKEVGSLFSITGAVGDAALCDDAGGVQFGPRLPGVVLPVGTLELRTSASDTGEMKWSIWYVPLDDGAYVTAA